MEHLHQMAMKCKQAARELALYDTETKNRALLAVAQALEDNMASILSANARDIAYARDNGLREAMIDRLALTEERVRSMAQGARQVAALEDPIGQVIESFSRPNGLHIRKVRVPLGVVGVIYEARPNVTADSAVLCFKAGNAAFLRGGKEAFRSMMGLRGLIDVLIPRGGAGLIRSVVENAKVPVIETGAGNCHVYVDKAADLTMAAEILFNAKCSRPSVCNAAESLLVHQDIASEFLPMAKTRLDECQVEWRGCPRTIAILPGIAPATVEDYAVEYNDYILSCKVVNCIEDAVRHIQRYTTGHSESIVTQDPQAAQLFADQVDAAAVYINASTRFTDGAEFGMGAEIGISTQKMHARGPMGLKELTSWKYIVQGQGQTR